MAVAQPVKKRAVEVFDFNDPTAGKAGPIALQIHNGGLFDEYKDVDIETPPKPTTSLAPGYAIFRQTRLDFSRIDICSRAQL